MGSGLFLLGLILFCNGLAEVSCLDHEVYIFIVKKSTSCAESQSFSIFADGEAIFTSPPFQDDTVVGFEACLNKTDGLHYTLQMRSTSGIWDAGSYIEIHGNYNNTFLKAYMQQKQVENIPFTLHYPIHLYSICKFISGISLHEWTVMSFDDSSWEDIPLGMVPEYRVGTQYFRIPFAVPTNLVAYEIRLRYRFGIIAYIEGLEIWRDHLPSGSITNNTFSTGDYGVNQFHGIIRSAMDFTSTSNNSDAKIVLAVALHFPDVASRTIDFDVWIAGYQSSIPGTNCYVIPTELDISSSQSVVNLEYLHDFDINTWMEWNVDFSPSRAEWNPQQPLHITWNYGISQSTTNITIIPAISGIRLFTPFASHSPSSLSLTAFSSSHIHTILSNSSFHGGNHSHILLTTSLSRWPSSTWNLTLDRHQDVVTLGEVHPLVCAAAPPTSLLFPHYAYFFSPQKEEEVIIEPAMTGFRQCSISPVLPAGLTLDKDSCRIQGVPSKSLPATTFTVSSVWDNPYEQSSPLQVSGSFELTIEDCKGEVIEITRTFQANAVTEGFAIRDSRGNLIFEQAPHSTQKDNLVWNHYLCVNTPSNSPYSIQFHSSEQSAWSSHSYLIIHHVLSPSLKLFKLRARKDEELEYNTDLPWFTLHSWISPDSEWYYCMGMIPSDWLNDEMSGYDKAVSSSIPSSSNQLQVFKRQFAVSSSEMSELSGVEISLRYQYGCVIAINGHIVFSYGVELPITNTSLATQAYRSLQYRTITIPSILAISATTNHSTRDESDGSDGSDQSKPIELLRRDQPNTIAVVLVSPSSTQTDCTFDATLSAIFNDQSRVSPTIAVTGEGLIGEPSSLFALDHQLVVKGQVLVENPSILISFPEGHYETITQLSLACARVYRLEKVGSFVVEGRKEGVNSNQWKRNDHTTVGNENSEGWEEIRTVDSLLWAEQPAVRIGLVHNTPYHQYRIRSIHSLSSTSAWQISQMDLRMTKRTFDSLVSFVSRSHLQKDLSFSLYSNTQSPFTSLYQPFVIAYSVLPDLPAGFAVDCCTGNLLYQYSNSTITTATATSSVTSDHRSKAGKQGNSKEKIGKSQSLAPPSSAKSTVYERTAVLTADNGQTVTVPIVLELVPCSDVITISILADSHPLESSWEIVTASPSMASSNRIFTPSTRRFQEDVFPVGNAYFHIPVCGADVANEFTTLRVKTSREHGWDIPSGYYLSQRSIVYAMDMMPPMKEWAKTEMKSSSSATATTTTATATTISQTRGKKWNVREMMLNEIILLSPENPVTYLTTNDEWLFISPPSPSSSRWEDEKVPMHSLPSSSKQYTVVRIEVPAVEMINFQVIHVGEIVLAANGYVFADFDGISATATATATTTSQMLTDYCHLLAGSISSPITLTIRLSSPPLLQLTALAPRSFTSSSSSSTITPNPCHILLDSIESIHCNRPVQQPLADLFDYHPEKMVTIEMATNTSVEWRVRNRVGTQFNAFGIFATEDRNVGASRIFGTDATFGTDQPIAVIDELSISSRELIPLPLNTTNTLSGYRQFKWVVLENSVQSSHSPQDKHTPLTIVGWMPMYCPAKKTEEMCTGGWPWSVGMKEGETRVIRCADGRGFMKRTCLANGWGEEERNCPGERVKRGWLLTIVVSVVVVLVMLGVIVGRRHQKRKQQGREDEYSGLLKSRLHPRNGSGVEAKPVV